ncbi:MAG: hypothetical protein IT454_09005 [Planctomycetes bacterium]|nr:hypothetical protein [Planctomycetota bacterium]
MLVRLIPRPVRPLLALSVGALILGRTALAQQPAATERALLEVERPALPEAPPAELSALPAAAFEVPLFDEQHAGQIWALGETYKARFDARGASLIPYFGSDAPRNFPLELRTRSVSVGGAPLALDVDAPVARDHHTVHIDRGAVTEVYDLAARALEQRFVFERLEQRGELVLRMDVQSELAGSDLGATLRFENELGRVDYGQAFALDARGEKLALDSTLVDGQLELRVPADFVVRAALPLVIDPLVTFYTVSASSRQEVYPDVAYDVSSDRWCVTWTNVWSASDHDVFARLATGNYQLLTTLTIDFTSETWTTPKIANNNATDSFLIVAAVVPSSGISEIRGRIVHPGSQIVDPAFNVTPADGAYRNWPDVGGDPYPASPSYFCVVFQRAVSSTNVDIEMQLVSPSGTLVGGLTALENGAGQHEHPYISNSLGSYAPDGLSYWTATWQYRYSSVDHDIYGAQISWSGGVVKPMFAIETSFWDETEPMAASVLDSSASGTERTYLVVYQRDYGSDHDILGAVMRGSTLLRSDNLVGAFDASVWYRDQLIPTTDSDGEKFLVGFIERDTPTSYNTDIWICDYFWTGSQLVPCELRANLVGSGQAETDLALHSMASSGGPRRTYLGGWVFENPTTGYDIVAGLWDGCGGGMVQSFCAGDGSSGTCPCNNFGASGRGCGNSANPSGALLSWSGEASIANDTFVLSCSGMPASVSSLFFQTASSSSAVPFGDGLRCASGAALRLPIQQNVGGAASYPPVGATPIHAYYQSLQAGAIRYYQAWYRDSANYCTSGTFNLSNALQVTWAP